ncbi:LLM class flavin-dependent oxidoreductase [Propionibacteriaceae bacterium G1746]
MTEQPTSPSTPVEIGVETFGDVTADADGTMLSHGQVLRDVVAEGQLADRVGLDFFGIGEHHRVDYAVSAPEVVMGALASTTPRIKLGSAVTVLSSDDPVRVFERFSTVQALSNGRAEIIAGRGSFIESFPLFGFDLQDYELLFEERLDLLVELLRNQPVTWTGQTRAGLTDQHVFPTAEQPIPLWVGVGGTPQSVVRAAQHGLGLMLAIIGGEPMRFAPLANLYRRALDQLGRPQLPVAAHLHGFVADTDDEAADLLFPHYEAQMRKMGSERGWGGYSRTAFDAALAPEGNLLVGSPETVAQKIAAIVKGLGLARIDVKYSNGTLPHEGMMRSIELMGTRVKPRVHELLAGQ